CVGRFGAALGVAVPLVYIGIREPRQTSQDNTSDHDADEPTNTFVQMYRLLRDDKPFRHFVTVRSLLLVSSLSPPFMVTLSIQYGAESLAGLGGFIVASGIAALIGGRMFGRMADRSSKQLMSIGAGVASGIILAVVIVAAIPDVLDGGWVTNIVFILAYFALTLMHTGVRVGRKTYVVDMA